MALFLLSIGHDQARQPAVWIVQYLLGRLQVHHGVIVVRPIDHTHGVLIPNGQRPVDEATMVYRLILGLKERAIVHHGVHHGFAPSRPYWHEAAADTVEIRHDIFLAAWAVHGPFSLHS